MFNEYYKKLNENCPKLMAFFCKVYGYTFFEDAYYCNYLLDATNFENGFLNPKNLIKRLQEHFDGNLEPFKLEAIMLIGHLEANGYHFDFLNNKDENGDYVYHIFIKRIENGQFINIDTSKAEKCRSFQYSLFDAALIASEHFEPICNKA